MLAPKSALTGLKKIVDIESSRYALGSVQFERDRDGNPIAVATDGRKLVALTWAEPAPESTPGPATYGGVDPQPPAEPAAPFLVRQGALAGLAKHPVATPRDGKPALTYYVLGEHDITPPSGDIDGQIAAVAATPGSHARVTLPVTAGRFPRWREVFPARAPGDRCAIRIDARYLRDVLDAIIAHCADGSAPCSVVMEFAAPVAGESGTRRDFSDSPVVITGSRPDGHAAIAALEPPAPPALAKPPKKPRRRKTADCAE